MVIIQQKLIWLIGSGTVLILLFRLNLRCAGLIDRSALSKFRIGFGLIFIGSLGGLISKIGISTGSLSQQWYVNISELIFGYVIGWCFILSGAVRWARRYFDQKGKPLAKTFGRQISENVSSSLIKRYHPNRLLSAVINDIAEIISFQAITLHRVTDDDGLRLTFESGLTEAAREKLTTAADKNSLIWKAGNFGHAVAGDKDLVLGDGSRLRSLSGPLSTAMSLPVRFENEILGVLTLYRKNGISFCEDDREIMEIVCDALGTSMINEITEKKYNLVSRYREMLILAVKPFERGEPLLSALIKSSKIIHGYIPFRSVSLYLHGDGKAQDFEFCLPTGGIVSVKTGYFPKTIYPQLYETSAGVAAGGEQRNFIFEILGHKKSTAHLMISLNEFCGEASYLPLLGAALGRKIAERLEIERAEKLKARTGQWLGALQHYQEKGLFFEDLSTFIKELASLVVDLTPVTFCRIIFADNSREYFKTIGLAQIRDLKWPNPDSSKIRLSGNTLHRKVLSGPDPIFYRCDSQSQNSPFLEEISKLFPEGIKHGLIVPLQMGDRRLGSLTVGDARGIDRSSLQGEAALFISSLAGLISQVLTWQKEKRAGDHVRAGKRTLMLRRTESLERVQRNDPGPSLRSRLNGPLAGILATCEYMQSGRFGIDADMNRFIDVIQRNATKIHDITVERSGKIQQTLR